MVSIPITRRTFRINVLLFCIALALWHIKGSHRMLRGIWINKRYSRVDSHFGSNFFNDKGNHSRSETSNCIRKDTVMFLKTHKTGSSTVTNILNRYGNKYNLTFALPKHESTFNWPRRLKTDFLVNIWTKPNIICNHARYTKSFLHHLFPKSSSKYITILREPLSHYESTFNYLELWKGLGFDGEDSMKILEQYLLSVSNLESAKMNLKDRSRLLRNPMLYDLGLDFRYYQDKKAVLDYINFLEKEFDLVMVMEYFDESAVLLKRLMCWDLDDVVFLKHNERQSQEKKNISHLLKENIKSWNAADFMLYDHFNKTLWKKIAAEGPGFYEDLAQFRRRKKEVFDMCVGPKPIVTEIYSGKYVQGHGLKENIPISQREFCSNLVKSELIFYDENTKKLKMKQEEIDSPGEFEGDKEFSQENDWQQSDELAHRPILSLKENRVQNTGQSAEGETKNTRTLAR